METDLDYADAVKRILAAAKLPATEAKYAELAKALIFLNEAGIPALTESHPSIGAETLAADIEVLRNSLNRIVVHLAKEPVRHAVGVALKDLQASAQIASPSAPFSLAHFAENALVFELAMSHFLDLKSDHAKSDPKHTMGFWAIKSLGGRSIEERYPQRQQLEAMFSPSRHRAVPSAIVGLLANLYEQTFGQEFTAYKDRTNDEYRGEGLGFACAVIDAFGWYALFESDQDRIRERVCRIWINGTSDRKSREEAQADLTAEERDALRKIYISDQVLPRDASQTD